jgi:hypothetical protein
MKLSSKYFAFALIAVMAVVSVASAAPMSQELSVAAQTSVVGAGAGCDFASGFAVGMGVAGLFGCVVCGGASLVISVGVLFAC